MISESFRLKSMTTGSPAPIRRLSERAKKRLRVLPGRRLQRVPVAPEDRVRLAVEVLAPLERVAAARALVPHPDLLEHPSGGGIAGVVIRKDAIQRFRVEGMTDDRRPGLGRVAATPVGDADPVAELGAAVLPLEVESDGAEERGIALPH